MLAYAYQTLREEHIEKVEAESFENIQNLFATILILGISRQVKYGLHRDYILEADSLSSPRGKIDFSSSNKQQTMRKKRLFCHYDTFSEDILLNRVLKTSIFLLLRHGEIKKENRQKLRKLCVYFNGVSEINPFTINWSAINYHRNNVDYKMIINICYLLIKELLQTEDTGQFQLRSFLDDQAMHRLYEKFIRAYYEKEHPKYKVTSSQISWNISQYNKNSKLPKMQSDIMLSFGDKTLIIDTKYYGKALVNSQYGDNTTFISGHLYQIFSYVKNHDTTNSGNVSGLLLYAKSTSDEPFDEINIMGENKIGLKSLDLSSDWKEIKSQLDAIPEKFLI